MDVVGEEEEEREDIENSRMICWARSRRLFSEGAITNLCNEVMRWTWESCWPSSFEPEAESI